MSGPELARHAQTEMDRKQTRCLGVPMRIKEIDGYTARCEARGIERVASLFLLQHEDLEVGDLVMIHVGNAIQKMTEEEEEEVYDVVVLGFPGSTIASKSRMNT